MMYTTAKPFVTLPKLEIGRVFNAIFTHIHAMIRIVSAANEAARLAEARKTIDIERLEQLGLFGSADS